MISHQTSQAARDAIHFQSSKDSIFQGHEGKLPRVALEVMAGLPWTLINGLAGKSERETIANHETQGFKQLNQGFNEFQFQSIGLS